MSSASKEPDEFSFSIEEKDLAHIFNILRNKTYSDKVLAVIREYSTNAADANRDNGNMSKGIEVQIPNVDDGGVFSVRDFGKGLTRSDVENIYCKYGKSTKRDNKKANGEMGIGSKAAFSYSDEFTITSFCDGIKVKYRAYIDQGGLGKIETLSSEPSSEPTGMKVEVPVKDEDFHKFQDTAAKFYQYFVPRPKFSDGCEISINPPGYIVTGKGWAITETGGDKIIMSNVAYPLDINKASVADEEASFWRNYFYHIYIESGDIDFASSREAIEYTERTINVIDEKYNKIQSEMVDKINAQLYFATDGPDAIHMYNQFPSKLTSRFNKGLNFNGLSFRQLTYGFGKFASSNNVRLLRFTRDVKLSGGFKTSEVNSLPGMKADEKIYYCTTRVIYPKMKELLADKESCFLLDCRGGADTLHSFLEASYIEKSRLVCIDNVIPKKASKRVKLKSSSITAYRLNRYGYGPFESKNMCPFNIDLEDDNCKSGGYFHFSKKTVELNFPPNLLSDVATAYQCLSILSDICGDQLLFVCNSISHKRIIDSGSDKYRYLNNLDEIKKMISGRDIPKSVMDRYLLAKMRGVAEDRGSMSYKLLDIGEEREKILDKELLPTIARAKEVYAMPAFSPLITDFIEAIAPDECEKAEAEAASLVAKINRVCDTYCTAGYLRSWKNESDLVDILNLLYKKYQ